VHAKYEVTDMNLNELAKAIPSWPDGHINNCTRESLLHFSSSMRMGWNDFDMQHLVQLNGLVASAKHLIANPPENTAPISPVGGTPAAVRMAA
jgi:hypothetical protein